MPIGLESLLRCPDFLVFRQEYFAGVYRSFQDGQYLRQSRGSTDEGVEISIALYIDEFEVANPLGTLRNIHKIVAVYWVILNLPAIFRGGLTVIQLAALGHSHDVKEFGYARFLEPPVKDLKLIEEIKNIYEMELVFHDR